MSDKVKIFSACTYPSCGDALPHTRVPSPQQAETTATPEMVCPNYLPFNFLENNPVNFKLTAHLYIVSQSPLLKTLLQL